MLSDTLTNLEAPETHRPAHLVFTWHNQCCSAILSIETNCFSFSALASGKMSNAVVATGAHGDQCPFFNLTLALFWHDQCHCMLSHFHPINSISCQTISCQTNKWIGHYLGMINATACFHTFIQSIQFLVKQTNRSTNEQTSMASGGALITTQLVVDI